MSEQPEGGFTVVIVPDDAQRTRTIQVTPRGLRIGTLIATTALLALAIILASWWYFAAQAARIPELEREIARLQDENAKVEELGRALTRLQTQSEKIRVMLGADILASSGSPETVPADASTVAPPAAQTGLSPSIPTSWPLAASGFVTRNFGSADQLGEHPGIDIAVANDTYIRASGAGIVNEAGTDSIYGLYVLVEHGNTGYSSMYGHASRLFVSAGDTVRQNEVIALSGTTGRSTAPHLHFEIRQEEQPVDPFSLVQQRAGS